MKEELKKEFPAKKVDELFKYLEEIEKEKDEKVIAEKLEKAQEIENELYEMKDSPTLIDVQVIINGYRNKYDITDPREIIHYDNGKGYVQ